MDIFAPIEMFSNWLTYNLLNLTVDSTFGQSLNFFVYDTLKILFLLVIITHLMSLIRFYLPIEKLKNFLSKHKLFGLDYLLATIFGAITPFCSCSSIPLFMGFVGSGLPIGVTFAFLITSPLINEIAISLFIGMFGFKITLIYILAGIIIGIIGGFILGRINPHKYIEKFIFENNFKNSQNSKELKLSKQTLKLISKESFSIIKKVFPYIIIGVGVGAIIHGYIPANFFEIYLEKAGFLSVPLAVILAVPMYANAAGVLPIIQALVDKGIPIGTAIAFMMAIVGLSLPEAMMLKKILKLPLLFSFFAIVTIGIIIIGYLLNFII